MFVPCVKKDENVSIVELYISLLHTNQERFQIKTCTKYKKNCYPLCATKTRMAAIEKEKNAISPAFT